MPVTQIKFSEFVDLLLVRLYQLDRERGDGFIDLNVVAASIREEVPPNWVFDAAKVLETRGLAQCIFTFGGVQAELTGEGRLYVEEGRGITGAVQNTPSTYFNVHVGGQNNVVVTGQSHGAITHTITPESERAPALKILDDIEQKIGQDQTIGVSKRDEATTSVHLLRLQFAKEEPDRSLVAALLDGLGRIATLAGSVATLVRILNG